MLHLMTPEKRRAAPDKVEFSTLLHRSIKNPPEAPICMDVYPVHAREMLKLNSRNRPASENVVRAYASQMKANKWAYTRLPVIFSDEGRLIDGQHRLMACVESGVSFKTDIVFGVKDSAFAYIDNGKVRTASDVFSINGVPNAPLMAAATLWVFDYEKGRTRADGGGGHKGKPTNAELYQEFLTRPDILRSTSVGYAFKNNRLAPPAVMTGAHYVCAKKCRSEADDFFTRLGEGLNFKGKTDPAFLLMQRLIKNAAADEKLSRTRIAAYTIKAWNAARRGRKSVKFSFGDDEPFPRAQ